MEARPDDQSDKPVRVDHGEIFLERGFAPVIKVLGRKAIDFDIEENRSHEWIRIIMNRRRDEVKFSEVPLEDIVRDEMESGIATLLHNTTGRDHENSDF